MLPPDVDGDEVVEEGVGEDEGQHHGVEDPEKVGTSLFSDLHGRNAVAPADATANVD